MRQYSLLQAYESNRGAFGSLSDFLEVLIQRQLCAYFFNEPLRITHEEVDFDPEKVEIETSSDGDSFKTLGEIRDSFKRVELKFNTQNLIRLWHIRRSDILKIQDHESSQRFEIDLYEYEIELPEWSHTKIQLGDLFFKEEELKGLHLFDNQELRRKIRPSENFMTVEVLDIDGQYIKDFLNIDQAAVLKELYTDSLNNPSFKLSFDEIIKIKGSKTELKPATLFSGKAVRNYISQKDDALYFNFNKTRKS